ncbi:steryl-sulfatase [Nematostella vectensis]|uniref:steryl-sulfatase n=1 Tax=Nematostella vectensis TaxID=45351 RepID=UPI00138FA7B0|nr:steryl-sulfatase [Nematostella vectensis]
MEACRPCLSCYVFALLVIFSSLASSQKKPNILIFIVDDLGYADLGCFGNDSLATPHIDKIATEGAKLTHNLAGESICTPSRAALLTGRYPVRTGLVPSRGGLSEYIRVIIFTANSGGLPRNETTFAKALLETGYSTGLVGKWHLGLSRDTVDDFHYHPLNHGFQYFYGLPLTNLRNCDSGGAVLDHIFPNWRMQMAVFMIIVALTGFTSYFLNKISTLSFMVLLIAPLILVYPVFLVDIVYQNFNCILMRNFDLVEQPVILDNLTARFTDESIRFMVTHKDDPFLLVVSYAKVHTALFTTDYFKGHSGHSPYGDNVEEMDWSVGQIMDALEELGVKNNTFVYFTSDNGPHLEEVARNSEYEGGWKGIYKGGKGQSWEGGIRVPTLVSWPSHIQPGIEIDEPTNGIDLFPTVLDIAGASMPNDRIIDGRNLIPLLTQQNKYSPHKFMYHYCAKAVHAVRYRPRSGHTTWKAHFMTPKYTPGTEACFGYAVCGCYESQTITHNPPLLFEITADPSESTPISPDDERYQPVVDNILEDLRRHKSNVDSVPSQIDYFWWYPRLQICCNFPYCSCRENITELAHYPGKTHQEN